MRGGPVLVVDDDAEIRDSIIDILEEVGYACVGASDGFDALAQAIARPPALILLDCLMPGIGGWEFMSSRLRYPEIVIVPVVMMTALSGTARARAASTAGPVAFLAKPFDVADLLRVVARHAGIPDEREAREQRLDPEAAICRA